MSCVVCGEEMDAALAPATHHPTCLLVGEPEGQDGFAILLKAKLTEIIEFAQDLNPRNSQVNIGPSEIGNQCDRQIGYRVAGIPHVNTSTDSWPATVGTSVHTWLEAAMQQWVKYVGTQEWFTETTLSVVDGVDGHSDLYWATEQTVIDWKTKGPDVLRKIIKHGPLIGEVIQAQIYGYGFEQAGIPVKRVALVYLSRSGWLKDMYVWHAAYDRSIAVNALNRVFRIAQKVIDLEILKEGHAHRWEQVDATPSDSCGMCPWYQYDRDPDVGADNFGCPGR